MVTFKLEREKNLSPVFQCCLDIGQKLTSCSLTVSLGVCRYGVVLKRLDLTKMAVDILVEAVTKQPLHWGAWQELATLITDREMVSAVTNADN